MRDHSQLTDKQRSIYDYLRDHLVEHHCLPTLREIAERFGFKSPTHAADGHIKALVRKGFLEPVGQGKHRSGSLRLTGVRLVLEDLPRTGASGCRVMGSTASRPPSISTTEES